MTYALRDSDWCLPIRNWSTAHEHHHLPLLLGRILEQRIWTSPWTQGRRPVVCRKRRLQPSFPARMGLIT